MKKLTISLVVALAIFSVSYGQGWSEQSASAGACQILDNNVDPVYDFSVGYIMASDVESFGESAVLEIDANWAMAYFYDVLGGNIDATLAFQSMFYTDTLDDAIPSQLVGLALDMGWTGRFQRGMAFQARFAPGIYSDLESFDGDMFFFPFSLAVIRNFNYQMSGIAGLEIRPGFARQVIPLIGVDFEPNDYVHISARLPESRVMFYLANGWNAHLGLEWRAVSFSLDDSDDVKSEMLSIDDVRLSCGATYRMSDELSVGGEFGLLTGREFEYEADGDTYKTDHDSATFIRFTLSGPF